MPGDLGTKGGLVTDERARVLRPDGSVIAGLYAAGNVSAAVMGRTYAGPGATIGPAMVFGYLARCATAAKRREAPEPARSTLDAHRPDRPSARSSRPRVLLAGPPSDVLLYHLAHRRRLPTG